MLLVPCAQPPDAQHESSTYQAQPAGPGFPSAEPSAAAMIVTTDDPPMTDRRPTDAAPLDSRIDDPHPGLRAGGSATCGSTYSSKARGTASSMGEPTATLDPWPTTAHPRTRCDAAPSVAPRGSRPCPPGTPAAPPSASA